MEKVKTESQVWSESVEWRGGRAWKMLAALQRSSMANPESLKDKAPGKCLICRQVGFGPKNVQTMTSLLKWLATNTINQDIGRHSALGTLELQGQVPSLP